jgi:hypothetical protein
VLSGLDAFQVWRSSSALLALLGFTSAAFLVVIDRHLWAHAPSHGYALLGFIQGDLAVLFLLTARPGWGSRLVWMWGALQVGLMGADILTAPQLGFTYEHLFRDTWGFWGFDLLFGVRLLQALHPKFLPRPSLSREGCVRANGSGFERASASGNPAASFSRQLTIQVGPRATGWRPAPLRILNPPP